MGTASVPIGARSSGIRHAIYLDSTFHLMSEQSLNCYSKAVRQKYDRFERRALLAVDHIFTVSQHVRQDVLDYYGVPAERTTAVGTGRGKIHAVDGPKDYSDCMTLFVAKERFEEKGGSLLLAGFRLAVQSDPRLKLVVVAQEQYREVVESIPGAEFKTALPWHELEAIFNRASLFAMPARYEPWGLVYIEALACRTPIMGLNRNALPELARNGDAGFLLDVATPDAVAKCLLDAFSNTERLAEMGRAGQEHAQKSYSWDKTAASIYSALFGSFASTKQPMSHDATKQRAEY
jgi:glycosyltransferase involved in cell wall biosynthesis